MGPWNLPCYIRFLIISGGGGTGGGGYFHMYAYWVCAAPKTPFSVLNFRSAEHIIFTDFPKKSVPEHIIFTNFQKSVPEHHNFWRILPFRRLYHFSKFSLISTRSSPPTACSSRSTVFSSSKRLKLVPEPHIFTLDRELVPEPCPFFPCRGTCLPKFGVSNPPPPPHPRKDL